MDISLIPYWSMNAIPGLFNVAYGLNVFGLVLLE